MELIRNFVIDVVSTRVKSRRFRPLMTNFYLTKRCNLRCRYCYPPGHEPELPVVQALELLERIRPRNPALNITGGEPLLYSGINEVIRRASELRFQPILLSTNGLLIDRVVEALHLVDHLVISLDSLERDVNEQLTGVPGSSARILGAIESCSEFATEKGYKLSLHAVIRPETIHGIEDILRFCESVGASLSLSPEHGRFDPNPELPGNEEYVALIDRLIELKRRGKPVLSSRGYLRAIRDFAPHRCFPFVSPRVEPDGRVYFPCQRIAKRHVYLQQYPSLDELMRQEAEWITAPACRRRCFLACYVEVEQYLKNPLAAIAELSMRRAIVGRARPSRATASRS
jgi:MoaA/NifB/PqqE/SkfB family radical SAM enzyme